MKSLPQSITVQRAADIQAQSLSSSYTLTDFLVSRNGDRRPILEVKVLKHRHHRRHSLTAFCTIKGDHIFKEWSMEQE